MKLLITLFIIFFLNATCLADPAIDFIDMLCLHGFEKAIPKLDAEHFCSCVRADMSPQLTSNQRVILKAAQSELSNGQTPNSQKFYESGLRDLVIAAQARCEAAFFSPFAPINIYGGKLQLTLRCGVEEKTPEAFISIKNEKLLSKTEQLDLDNRMMTGSFRPEYALVSQKIDGKQLKNEQWEIDLSGGVISPANPSNLIEKLRYAKDYEVIIKYGQKQFIAKIPVTNHIPPKWTPCGGIGL